MNQAMPDLTIEPRYAKIQTLKTQIWRFRGFYLMMIPPIIYFLIFKYGPIWNAQIAFKDFKPLLGVWGSPWIGLKHFETFVNSFYFGQLIGNTVFFSVGKLVLGIPMAVICALALHETIFARFRTIVQTIIYMPHFLSWVVMFGVLLMLLSPNAGLINDVIKKFGGN